MNRSRKLILNIIIPFLKQIIVIIYGFILPRYILVYFGSDINGLTASISQFLGFISFMELGIGPVIQSNLYKPLVDKDNLAISKIVKSSNKFFRTIAIVFSIYVIVLTVLFPAVIDRTFDFWFTASLVLIISVGSIAQYYIGATYTILLNADQKVYVQSLINIATIILNTVFCIVFIKNGCSIQIVVLTTSFIYMLRPLCLNLYIKKNYDIDKKVVIGEEPIKQKWNGFAQHLAACVSSNVDVILLTLFSTLLNVSIYSVYYNVVNGISSVILSTVTGLESYWGSMIAKNEEGALKKSFELVETIIHSVVIFVFVSSAVLIAPFVSVYVEGVENANAYNIPIFGVLLVASYGALCLRIPYFRIVKAAGHYKQTQLGSFISVIINVVVSTILVFKFALLGVAIGTLTAFMFHTIYLAWYIRKNIVNRHFKFFLQHIFVDVLMIVISVLSTSWISLVSISYLSWILMALEVSGIVLTVVVVSTFFFYRNHAVGAISFIKRKTE